MTKMSSKERIILRKSDGIKKELISIDHIDIVHTYVIS